MRLEMTAQCSKFIIDLPEESRYCRDHDGYIRFLSDIEIELQKDPEYFNVLEYSPLFPALAPRKLIMG